MSKNENASEASRAGDEETGSSQTCEFFNGGDVMLVRKSVFDRLSDLKRTLSWKMITPKTRWLVPGEKII